MKIGFFDSGLGGLTILSEVRKRLPMYDYVYFGDNAHVPYGDKTEEEVFELTRSAVQQLFDAGARLVIIACNTASAETLRKLQDSILTGAYAHHRILGVIVPTIEVLLERNYQHVLLIGTERTIRSHKYERELANRGGQHIEFHAYATPGQVPLIEMGDMTGAETQIREYLDVYLEKGREPDVVILGCTHYAFLKDIIRRSYRVAVLSQDELIPEKLEQYLLKHTEIETVLSRGGTVDITFSKASPEYETQLCTLFQEKARIVS